MAAVKKYFCVVIFPVIFLFMAENSFAAAGTDWYAATLNAAFSPRHQAAALDYNGRMWIIAGGDLGTSFSDVWSSVDGITWTLATASAPFGARAGHTAVVFDDGTGDKMYVIGGNSSGAKKNDVWSSTDGITWVLVTPSAGFTPRWGLRSVVYNGRIWVTGGDDGVEKNDVWSSADGVTWVQSTAAAAFSQRSYPIYLNYDDGSGSRMWVITGFNGVTKLNDVWWSVDGVDWNLSTGNAQFAPRYTAGAVVYDNKMWVIGGFGNSARTNDVWWSADGVTWNNATMSAAFSGRESMACTVYNGKMWLISGVTDSPMVQNDVWYSSATTNTPTITPSLTATITITPTFTVSLTVTQQATYTCTLTATGTATPTMSYTSTLSSTQTTVISPTFTPSNTHSFTVTSTATRTATHTTTMTITPTPTSYPEGEIHVYPNPFNPGTAALNALKFDNLPLGAKTLIYDISGELVFMSTARSPVLLWKGININGNAASPGIYYYTVSWGDNKRMIVGKIFLVNR